MLNYNDFKDYVESLVERSAIMKEYVLVVNEAQFKEFIKDVKKYPVLVAVIPSAMGGAFNEDNVREESLYAFFVLYPKNNGLKHIDYHNRMAETQAALVEIKDRILDDYNNNCQEYPFLHGHDWGGYHIDPEYDYLGFFGWSMTCKTTTWGY